MKSARMLNAAIRVATTCPLARSMNSTPNLEIFCSGMPTSSSYFAFAESAWKRPCRSRLSSRRCAGGLAGRCLETHTHQISLSSLLDSLSKQPSDSARVKLLIGVTEEAAPTRRKIGKAIAERIIEVLCAPVYKQKSVAATADSGDM